MINGLILQLNNLLHVLALPHAEMFRVVFYLLAGWVILFALCMVLSRNIFHTAIFLAMTLIGIAGVYLCLDAEFLAIIQILVYVGAIVTLFLFAIMLTVNIKDRTISQTNKQVLASLIAVLAIFYLFVRVIRKEPWLGNSSSTGILSLPQLGRSLMTTYVLPFEVISLVLVGVLVGAIVIGKVDKK